MMQSCTGPAWVSIFYLFISFKMDFIINAKCSYFIISLVKVMGTLLHFLLSVILYRKYTSRDAIAIAFYRFIDILVI